ncbi:MAG: hypothetical protein ACI9Y8_002006 [Candidatus Omnitrophota bacterium]|jgi:hypothetical protein
MNKSNEFFKQDVNSKFEKSVSLTNSVKRSTNKTGNSPKEIVMKKAITLALGLIFVSSLAIAAPIEKIARATVVANTTFSLVLSQGQVDGTCCVAGTIENIDFGTLADTDDDGFMSGLNVFGFMTAFTNGLEYNVKSTMAALTDATIGESLDVNSVGVQTLAARDIAGVDIAADTLAAAQSAVGVDKSLYISNGVGTGGAIDIVWFIPSFDGSGALPFTGAVVPNRDIPVGTYVSTATLTLTVV